MAELYPDVTGCKNLRGLGKIRVANGKTVKSGLFLRSGELSHMTADDYKKLPQIGLVIDLRGDADRLAAPDVLPEGSKYLNFAVENPSQSRFASGEEAIDKKIEKMVSSAKEKKSTVLQDTGYSALARDKKIEAYFKTLSNNDFQKALVSIITEISGNAGHAVIWHCSAGKDRTGILSAVLLSLLGASEEDIVSDYLISDLSCREDRALAERLASKYTDDEDIISEISNRFGVVPDWIEAILCELKRAGGAKAYCLSLDGLTEELIRSFIMISIE